MSEQSQQSWRVQPEQNGGNGYFWRPYCCEVFLGVWKEQISYLRTHCRWLSDRQRLNRALAEAFRVDSNIAERRGIYRLTDLGNGEPVPAVVNGSAAAHLPERIGADCPRTSQEWPSSAVHQAKRLEPGWESW